MCLNPDAPEIRDPAPPPEVLEQDAPEKKKANQKSANALAIGTKKYRSETGLGTTGTQQNLRPAGPSVSV